MTDQHDEELQRLVREFPDRFVDAVLDGYRLHEHVKNTPLQDEDAIYQVVTRIVQDLVNRASRCGELKALEKNGLLKDEPPEAYGDTRFLWGRRPVGGPG